jgi:hypothetical protein
LLLAVAIGRAETADQALISRVNETSANIYNNLKSFVCDERIERVRSALNGERERPIDVVTASLSFESGSEEYRNIRQNAVARESMSSIAGAWSEGEFGSLLLQTGQLLRSQPITDLGEADENGEKVAIYAFEVGANDSPWQLVIESNSYRVAFRTEIWVSAATGQILRIARRTLTLPAAIRISAIDWSVTLRQTRLQGSDWTLPASAEYGVSYAEKNRRELNRITFDHYRRYGSEVAVRFGGQ